MGKTPNSKGGRPTKPGRKVMLSMRVEPHILAALKAGAKKAPGKNVSTFAEYLIDKGLRQRAEEKRDPALKALLHFIGQIAVWASGRFVMIEKQELHDRIPAFWRTDQLSFRAFKFAVRGLLDLIEEPPGDDPLAREGREKFLEVVGEAVGTSPDMSPERLGETILYALWFRGTEDHAHIQAVRDLQLKSKPAETRHD
jgi:hypothetical protein